jgi:hypothetical protein
MINTTSIEDSKTIFSNRHLNYLDVAGLCWQLFKSVQKNPSKVPSCRFIESVDEKFVEYCKKNFELLGDSRVFGHDERSEEEEESAMAAFFEPEETGLVHVFLITKFNGKDLKDSIVLKINDHNKTFLAGASSFNSEELDGVMGQLYKEFGLKPDYNNKTFFGILLNVTNSTEVKQLPIDDKFSKNLDIALNYGKSFQAHHEKILEKLKTNSNGLFIFHGSAGTGKTTYIKHLAKLFGGKRMFIFIPTTFIDALTSPSIIPVLLEHPNSVLVLEDAEKAVVSREENLGNESLVSSLLNIGDGILGSMLNLSIILTFNTAKENVDKALLRKGRLHYEHEFGKLPVDDAQNLIKVLNKDFKVTDPMSLAEIYNIENDNNHKEIERPKVGFGQ